MLQGLVNVTSCGWRVSPPEYGKQLSCIQDTLMLPIQRDCSLFRRQLAGTAALLCCVVVMRNVRSPPDVGAGLGLLNIGSFLRT